MQRAKAAIKNNIWRGYPLQRGFLFGADSGCEASPTGMWVYPACYKPIDPANIRIMRPIGDHDIWREFSISVADSRTARDIMAYFWKSTHNMQYIDNVMYGLVQRDATTYWNRNGCYVAMYMDMGLSIYDVKDILDISSFEVRQLHFMYTNAQECGKLNYVCKNDVIRPTKVKTDYEALSAYHEPCPRSLTIPGLGQLR